MNVDTFVTIRIGEHKFKIRWYWIYAWAIGMLADEAGKSEEMHDKASTDFDYGMSLFNKAVSFCGMGLAWDKLSPHLCAMDEKPLYKLSLTIEKDATNA